MKSIPTTTAPLVALCSAIFFGASTPFAKFLLGNGIGPVLLAGIYYFGSDVGLALFGLERCVSNSARNPAPLRKRLVGA